MRTRRLIVATVFTATLLLTSCISFAQSVHAIVLHDSNQDISHSAELSCSAIGLSVFGSVPERQLEYSSGAVNRKGLLDAIDRVRISAGDSILFYYCGHGYINQKGTPYILPGGGRDPLYLKDILARLKRVGAHRTIALFDICQSLRPTIEGRPAPIPPDTISPLFRSILFGEPNGVPYCVISSAPGEAALAAHFYEGHLAHGSVFSRAFSTVSNEYRNVPLGWRQMVQAVTVATSKEFASVKNSKLGVLGDTPVAALQQTTQTVTEYRPIEIR